MVIKEACRLLVKSGGVLMCKITKDSGALIKD